MVLALGMDRSSWFGGFESICIGSCSWGYQSRHRSWWSCFVSIWREPWRLYELETVLVDNMCHLLLLKAYRSLLIYGSALYGSVTSQIEESKGQLFWSRQILCMWLSVYEYELLQSFFCCAWMYYKYCFFVMIMKHGVLTFIDRFCKWIVPYAWYTTPWHKCFWCFRSGSLEKRNSAV